MRERGISEITSSNDPNAHAIDVREGNSPKVPSDLKIISPKDQRLPPYGPEVTDKTFSNIPDAHR